MVEYAIGVALIATFFAMRGAIRGVKGAYRSRRTAWRNDHPDANGFETAAAAAGNLFGVVRYGPPALVRGWRTGWTGGKEAAAAWAGYEPKPKKVRKVEPAADPDVRPASLRPRPAPATDQAAPPDPDPAPLADNVIKLKPRARTADPAPQPAESPAAPQPTADQPAPTANGGLTVARILTANGGDVHNAEMLKVEAGKIAEEWAYEYQDAGHDRARHQQHQAGIEAWVADLARAQAPDWMIAQVQALVDPARAIVESAEDRVAAADANAATARKVLGDATADAQFIDRRVGPWYGNNTGAR